MAVSNWNDRVVKLLEQVAGSSNSASGSGGDNASATNQQTQTTKLEEIRDRQFDYSGTWKTIRSLSNIAPDTDLSAPADGAFVALDEPFTNGVSKLEVLLDGVAANAKAVTIALWVRRANGEKTLLETRRFAIADIPEKFAIDIEQKDSDLKYAVKVSAEPLSTVLAFNGKTGSYETSETNIFPTTDTPVDLSYFSNAAGITSAPLGLGGNLKVNVNADTVVFSGFSPDISTPLEADFTAMGNPFMPCWGISGRISSAETDLNANTFRARGSAIDFSLPQNRVVRLKSAGSSALPNLAFSAIANVTLYITSCTGAVGDQTITLGTDPALPLPCTYRGTGWSYIFPWGIVRGISRDATNQLTINGNLVDLKFDHLNVPVTVAPGTAGVFRIQGNYTGSVFPVIVNGSVGANFFAGATYFTVPSTATYDLVNDRTTFSVSAISGGLPIAFTGVTAASITVDGKIPSLATNGTAASITLPNHFLAGGNVLTLGGATLPGGYTAGGVLYAISVTAGSFTVSDGRNTGAPVAFTSAGSSVTLTCALSITALTPIRASAAYVRKLISNTLEFAFSNGGAAIPLASNSQSFSVRATNAIALTGNIKVRGIL